jgi:hypothetical protein
MIGDGGSAGSEENYAREKSIQLNRLFLAADGVEARHRGAAGEMIVILGTDGSEKDAEACWGAPTAEIPGD